MTGLSRRKSLIESRVLAAIAWGIFALCVWHWWPGSWPWHREGRLNVPLSRFILIAWIVDCLWDKTYLMYRRTRRLTSFGLSLIAMNAAFCIAYVAALAFTFWWWGALNHDLRIALTLIVAVPVTWARFELMRSEDPIPNPGSAWSLVDELVIERDDLRAQNQTLLDIVKARYEGATA